MGLHDPFGHSTYKLWPKEGSGVKLPICLSTTKSRESLRFPCAHVMCNIHWKDLDEGYNFVYYLISIEDLHAKLWAPKVVGMLSVGNSGSGSPRTKWHLGGDPVGMHKIYSEGEGGGFPQVQGCGKSCEFEFAHSSS